jgi:hypothetical protein
VAIAAAVLAVATGAPMNEIPVVVVVVVVVVIVEPLL